MVMMVVVMIVVAGVAGQDAGVDVGHQKEEGRGGLKGEKGRRMGHKSRAVGKHGLLGREMHLMGVSLNLNIRRYACNRDLK